MVPAFAIGFGEFQPYRNVVGFGGDFFAEGAQLVIAVPGIDGVAYLALPGVDGREGRDTGPGDLGFMDAGNRERGAGSQERGSVAGFHAFNSSSDNSSPGTVRDFSTVPAGNSKIECAVRQADNRQAGSACLTLRTFRCLSR